uniref:Pecanex-like protein n=1 Tax=Echinostoma caproni TaxID=27848 RepID=A0A183ABL4_9TREM
LSKWDSNDLRYSPERDLIALHSPILFDSDDTDDLLSGLVLQPPLTGRKPKRGSATGAQTVDAVNGPHSAPYHRRTGSQRGRAAMNNGITRGGADIRQIRQSQRADAAKRDTTQLLNGKTATTPQPSDHSTEAADHTVSSLLSSSDHPSTGNADDSGLGESIKPLSSSSTKSCLDVTSDGSTSLSVRALHLSRSRSWPRDIVSLAEPVGPHGDEDEDEEEPVAECDLMLDRCTINRTRSCSYLPDDVSESALELSMRRIHSLPNWPVTDGEDTEQADGQNQQNQGDRSETIVPAVQETESNQ